MWQMDEGKVYRPYPGGSHRRRVGEKNPKHGVKLANTNEDRCGSVLEFYIANIKLLNVKTGKETNL